MNYTPQLKKKANGRLCKICYEYITESEADSCEFQYVLTSSRREIFVHTRCLEIKKGVKA